MHCAMYIDMTIVCIQILLFLLLTLTSALIIESVDPISRDGRDCPYMQYITKMIISQSTYRVTSSNCHYRNLRV